jgi:voltage-dependent calcium channel
LYSIFAVAGTAVTTIMAISGYNDRIFRRVHKLFLVAISLLLIPRNNQLDQLFKTAAASLTAIGNLLATWVVLFLVFAIAFTQTFGLTRFGGNESDNLNFRNVPKALILLFRMSCGEGWNQIMEDFATISPPYCTPSDDFFQSDCGSAAWARVLFISWNIVSMYIFVSLFVSLIFESFSYVYQRSSGLSVVSREEIRRFKQAWATFDPDGTGYISKEQFPRLLGVRTGSHSSLYLLTVIRNYLVSSRCVYTMATIQLVVFSKHAKSILAFRRRIVELSVVLTSTSLIAVWNFSLFKRSDNADKG